LQIFTSQHHLLQPLRRHRAKVMPIMLLAGSRLVAALLLTLLPGFVLAVLGLRALSDKEAGLRTQYTATIVLLRDRLAADLSVLEAQLRDDLALLAPNLDEHAPRALTRLTGDRPWVSGPFLLRDDGAVVTPLLQAGLSNRGTETEIPRAAAAAISKAESAELDGRLEDALTRYRSSLSLVTAAPRALVRARIGRVLLKMRRWEEAVVAYRTLLEEAAGVFDRNGIPYVAVARMQLAEALTAAGRPSDASTKRAALLVDLLRHPWDVDNGYGYYLGMAASVAEPRGRGFHDVQALQRSIGTIEWARREVQPLIEAAFTGAVAYQPLTVRTAATGGQVSLRCVRSAAVTLCFSLATDYVAGRMLSDVLQRVALGRDVSVAMLGDGKPIASPTRLPLVSADLGFVPGWSIALFDSRGRSVAELVRRERWMYRVLIAAMMLMLIGGTSLMLRVSSREVELVRLKSEFVSNVSHELKTPLTLIRMFGETLESGIVTDDRKRTEFSAVIRRESERLTHLINNVLDVARIEAGTKQYSFESVDIVSVVRDAVDTYRPLFERLGFAVVESLPREPVVVIADRDAMAQALVNLFQNSIKYSDRDKHVTVTLTLQRKEVAIVVADLGVGIRPADQPRVFDRYYRVRSRATMGAQGSGLGLAIVKHVVDAHGGRVELQSTVGKGSAFVLILPAPGVPSLDSAAAVNHARTRGESSTPTVPEAGTSRGNSTLRRA
jgi:signal transduction histidine kinase